MNAYAILITIMLQATVSQWLFHTEPGHFLLYFATMAIVSTMPSPTASSSVAYVWLFGICNFISANLARVLPPRVEKSPNWQDAVQKAQNGAKVNQ